MRKMFFVTAMAACVMTSCTNDDANEVMDEETEQVTLSFSPYQMDAMTRAATSISNYCTHLDVWLINGGDTIHAHQSTADADFGTVSVPLNKTKTYNIIAIAHKCDDDAVLADSVISFPGDKISHSMIYTDSFKPSSKNMNCEMNRIVGQFRLEVADSVSLDVTKFEYTIKDTYNQWKVNNTACNKIDRTGTINLTSRNADGTANINIFVLPNNLTETTNVDITFRALAADDKEKDKQVFKNVPIKAGYKTTYHGNFFVTDTIAAGFKCEDWSVFDVVNF